MVTTSPSSTWPWATNVETLSPSGRFFVDSYSKPDAPPIAVLRSTDGKLINTLEKADISRLTATGWKPVTPITVKARDGVTDLYGLLYRPTNFDPAKKYPIVNRVYPASSFDREASAYLEELASRPPGALSLTKRLLYELDGMSLPQALERGAEINAQARMSEECRAGVRRFLEKTQ